MNINNLSSLIEFKEEISKIPVDIDQKIIWTENTHYDINEYLTKTYGWNLGETNEQRIISNIYNCVSHLQSKNHLHINNYSKKVKTINNETKEIDFYYKDNIVKVKYEKKITFDHILEGILLSLFSTEMNNGSFQLWNFYDSLNYKFTFTIKDKTQFLELLTHKTDL